MIIRKNCATAVLYALVSMFCVSAFAAPQMYTPGNFAVSPRGEATYSLGIQVPPGIAGLEPSLTLMYSSDSGNGHLGVDWSLGASSEIQRCPQTRAQDGGVRAVSMDANDRFCLDGTRLVLVSGTYGAEGSEYRTEIDSLTKIIAHTSVGNGPTVSNGPAWFEVWTKAGQYKTYGNSTDSRVLAVGVSPATARVWALNRVQDALTNYMTYTYTQDTVYGDYYPQQINYTGNTAAGQAPIAQISFVWGTRPDIVTVYQAGAMIKGQVLLTDIKTYIGSGATLVRDYKLGYRTSVSTNRSEINTITECPASGACLPPSNFTWTDHVVGLNNGGTAITGVYGNWQTTGRIFSGDFNGDGIADIAMGPDANGNWYVMLGNGTGFSDKGTWITGTDAEWVAGADGIRVMDVNGDGLADIEMGPDANGNWYVLLSTGHSFVDGGAWATGKYANWTSARARIYPIDVNGDGLEDLLLGPDGTGNWYVLESTGSGFTDMGVWATAYANWVSQSSRTYIADVNGDGLQDVVLGPDESGNWYVLRSTGTGFVNDGAWITGADAEWYGGTDGIRPMDVNGDGLQDIEMGPDANGNWYVLLSTGKSFVDAGAWATGKYVGYVGGRNRIYATDTNGDGLQDLIMGPDANGNWNVLRSNGSSFVDDGTVLTGAYGNWTGDASITRAMDVNGDGLKDIVLGPDSSGNWYQVTSNPANERITAINNGLATTTLSYLPMTNSAVYTKDSGTNAALYPIMDVQFPGYVVSSVQSPNGIGGTTTSNYTYGGFKIDLTGRGMLGNRWIEATRPAVGSFAARSTYTVYNQLYPFNGLVAKTQELVTGGGNSGLLSEIDNTYECYSGSASPAPTSSSCTLAPALRYLTYSNQSVQSQWDLNGTALPSVTTTYGYDNWGNALTIDRVADDGYSTYTVNTYLAANTTSWILGRLSSAQVTKTSPQVIPGGAGLVSLAITPASPTVLNGSSAQLTATATYSDGSTQILTDVATWTSSATTVATVSNTLNSTGIATGHALGTTSVTAAASGVTSPAVTLTVATAEYAYAGNFNGNTISQYVVGANGELTPNTTASVVTGTQPFSIAVDPTGHYLYAANYNNEAAGTISQYTIGATGLLTPNAAGATVAITSQTGPNGITAEPSGNYVYVANYGTATVSQFKITPSTGTNPGSLTLLATVAAGTGAASVALNPANTVAYVPNYLANTVSVYTIGANGALTLASTTTIAGSNPSYALVDPTGKYLYVAGQGNGNVYQFTIGTNGALTPMSTASISVGGNPRSLVLDPTHAYVFAPNSGTNVVSHLSIGAGGALSLTGTTNVGSGTSPAYLAFDQTGQYAFVADRGAGTISQYVLEPASSLAPSGQPTVAAGSGPAVIVTTKEY